MKIEEYRNSIPTDIRTHLPKSEQGPCFRGTLDLELYNRTGEIEYIEPLEVYVPPVDPLEAPKHNPHVKRKGAITMNPNKPSKEALEKDLRSGMSGPKIADKYDCRAATVHNWIKGYGLQGLQGVRKPKGKPVIVNTPVDHIVEADEMVQESPAEVEQVHADEVVQEQPSLAELLGDEYELTLGPDEPVGMTEEENMTDEEWEAQGKTYQRTPRETCGEIWEDVQADLVTLQGMYVKQADKEFRAQLLQLVLAVTNGQGIEVKRTEG